MENNINIAELLKDCPKGTKLYSPVCGECEFVEMAVMETDLSERIVVSSRNQEFAFKENGFVAYGDECLLFPTKEVRDWGLFNVKYVRGNNYDDNNIQNEKLLKENGGIINFDIKDKGSDCILFIDRISNKVHWTHTEIIKKHILSTGTELKLEEEQPKFKVGDVVNIRDCTYMVIPNLPCYDEDGEELEEENYEIQIGNANANSDARCIRFSTPEEITKWNEEMLEPNHLHYDSYEHKIVDWFNPKDDVLVRNEAETEWRLCTFSHRSSENGKIYYCASGSYWSQCLPYNEKTAKLIGTTDNYEEE